MNLNNIKGFDKLSEPAKAAFIRVYAKHKNAVESDLIATKVIEHKKYIEVHFADGSWLHYCPDGSWF